MRIRMSNGYKATHVRVDVENQKNIDLEIKKKRSFLGAKRVYYQIVLTAENGDNLKLELDEDQLLELTQLLNLYNENYKDKNADRNTSKLVTIMSDERGQE